MKTLMTTLAVFLFSLTAFAQTESFHNFSSTTIDGNIYPFAQLRGKKVIIVNVDVQDQLAPQYAILQELYNQYSSNGLIIIGFPTNDFDTQIAAKKEADNGGYRLLDYDVSFPVMIRTTVVGDSISPIYQWLTEKTLNGKQDAPVTGNFQKFLIDENGQWAGVIPPEDSAFNIKILNWISGK